MSEEKSREAWLAAVANEAARRQQEKALKEFSTKQLRETFDHLEKHVRKTSYQQHQDLQHDTTWNSPNGLSKIEECLTCGMRFLHDTRGFVHTLQTLPRCPECKTFMSMDKYCGHCQEFKTPVLGARTTYHERNS